MLHLLDEEISVTERVEEVFSASRVYLFGNQATAVIKAFAPVSHGVKSIHNLCVNRLLETKGGFLRPRPEGTAYPSYLFSSVHTPIRESNAKNFRHSKPIRHNLTQLPRHTSNRV